MILLKRLLRLLLFLPISLVIVAVPVITLQRLLPPWASFLALSTRGLKVQAEVLQVEDVCCDNIGQNVTYRFSVPENAETSYIDTKYSYDPPAVGSTVTITFLPDDPTISRFAGSAVPNELIIETLLLGFLRGHLKSQGAAIRLAT